MILDTPSTFLQAVLSTAVASTQPEVHVKYIIYNIKGDPTKPQLQRSALNNTTDVNILSAPNLQGYVAEVVGLTVYNKDSANVTVTIKTDSGTERIIVKYTLMPGETLVYEQGYGWGVIGP